MTYPLINGTLVGSDLTQLIVYANNITYQLFSVGMLFAFFMIILIGGSIAQQRFGGIIKFEQSFAAASFSTFGLATILMMRTGALNLAWYFITIGLTIVAALWLYFGTD